MRFLKRSYLLFFHILCFSQIQISGIITDSIHRPLSYANIEVLKGQHLITYAISNESGNYKLSLKASGSYIFKVSHLGYKSRTYQKEITSDASLDFALSEKVNIIDEVVIKGELPDAILKKDTLKYDLKKIVNGNEENLKDILKKLPGIEIDERGKIKAGGKTIDKLLINGREFFGSGQHRLATENINSEMVGGIELINNYKAFSDLGNSEKTGKTALNVAIKKEFKGKIGGDFLLQGGYKNRYLFHTNLYKFDEKTDWFFIGDMNNLGRQAFTLEDYIYFKGGVDKLLGDDSNITSLSSDDLPSFLLSNNDVKNRTPQFSALNFSTNPTDKLHIHAFSIFSQLHQAGLEKKTSTFFTSANPIIYDEKIEEKNRFLFNNTFLDVIYKPSKKMLFNYTATYIPSNNRLDKEIYNNAVLTDELRKGEKSSLAHSLKYNQLMGNNSLFTFNFFYSMNKKDEDLMIDSDNPFLNLPFIKDDFSITQNTQWTHTYYGIKAGYSKSVWKNIFLNLTYRAAKKQNDYTSLLSDSLSTKNDNIIDRNENLFLIGISKKNDALLNYNFGVAYRMVNTRRPNRSKAYHFLPEANIHLRFSQTHTLNLFYKHESKFPDSKNLVENKIISDYRSVFINDQVKPSDLSSFNKLGIQYFYYDLFSQTLLGLVGSYDKSENEISLDSEDKMNYVINKYVLSPHGTNVNILMILDKKIPKIPFSIRFNPAFSLVKSMNYIKRVSNEIISKTISGKFVILSAFKKSKINFETGIKMSNKHITYQINDKKTDLTQTNPFFNLNGDYKNFIWKIDFSIESYRSENLRRTNYILSPRLVFKKPGKRWEFSLSGDNILNINNTRRVEASNTDNLFEERNYTTLPGSVVLGIKYKL